MMLVGWPLMLAGVWRGHLPIERACTVGGCQWNLRLEGSSLLSGCRMDRWWGKTGGKYR